ncbi:MAG: glycosyltransferase family 39 protein [Acidimicrobiales bacterium]|nr:glycosyltransferase family 39 protein [Acidimicrobiales bacterium]
MGVEAGELGADGAVPEAAAPPPVGARSRRRGLRCVDRWLLAVVALGVVLRFWGIGAQSLWYDEWLTSRAASGDLDDLRGYVTGQAGIPPTYFAVMWVWARVVGDGDAALRSFSALAGVATIPVAYATVRELGRRRAVARAAALLVAVHPALVWYSQEARPYSLLCLLGALSLWALARLWTRRGRGDLVVWAVVCALAIAVHYFAVFLVAAEVLAVLVARRPARRDVLSAGAAAGVVLVLLSPFAIRQFSRRGNHDWMTDYGLRDRLSNAGHGALAGPTLPTERWWLIAAAVVALAVVLLAVRGDRGERRAAGAAAGLGIGTVALALAANLVRVDMVLGRYLIVTLVLFIVAVAIALGTARAPRGVGWGGVAVLCGVSLVSIVVSARDPDLQRADWQAVAEAHQAGASGGDRLLVMNFHGYLGRPLQRYLEGERVVPSDETVTVEQIDFLVSNPSDRPCDSFIGLECALIFLGFGPTEAVAPDLGLRERIDLGQFTIERYDTDGPLTVPVEDLVPPNDLPYSMVLLTSS